MGIVWFIVVLAGMGALGWFAYGMDPHYSSKDGTRFLSNTQEFMGGKSIARKREARCAVLPDGTIHVTQKAGMRRKMQVWTLVGKQAHDKKPLTLYIGQRRDPSEPAPIQLMIRVPNRSRVVPVLDQLLAKRAEQ